MSNANLINSSSDGGQSCIKGRQVSTKLGSLCIVCVQLDRVRSVRYSGGSNVFKSVEGQLGLSELSVISLVSAVEGCPLSGVPLYLCITLEVFVYYGLTSYVLLISIHVLLELILLEVGIGLVVGSTDI